MLFHLDEPVTQPVERPVFFVRGWCVAEPGVDLAGLRFVVDGRELAVQLEPRADVAAAFAGQAVTGFQHTIDLADVSVEGRELRIVAMLAGAQVGEMEVALSSDARRRVVVGLDEPAALVVDDSMSLVEGWCALLPGGDVRSLEFYLNGEKVSFQLEPRWDAARIYPRRATVGFRYCFDTPADVERLEFSVVAAGHAPAQFVVGLSPRVEATSREEHELRKQKLAWYREHLHSPSSVWPTMLFHLDEPVTQPVDRPVFLIQGWCVADRSVDLATLRFAHAGRELPFTLGPRADLAEAFPDKTVTGFQYTIDLAATEPGLTALRLTASIEGAPAGETSIALRDTARRTVVVGLDEPWVQPVDGPIFLIRGWCALLPGGDTNSLQFFLNGERVPFQLESRWDASRIYPERSTVGFRYCFDLAEHPALMDAPRVEFQVTAADHAGATFGIAIHPKVAGRSREGQAAKLRKREWCLRHLQCLACGAAALLDEPGQLVCAECGTLYPQETRALNLLTPELARQCALQPAEHVSAHWYDPGPRAVIDETRAKGGMVLDCGAGLRRFHDPAVINVEIVDYPSTDVLAVGQALPFVDACFDAVLSLNVLEHVSDPFRCAQELLRVLKPGGTLCCIVPFLQPEHGYPNHFYNMTQQGLAQLFGDRIDIQREEVPESGLPIWALCQFLAEYASQLPAEVRTRFLARPLSDFINQTPDKFLKEEFVTELPADAQRILASTNLLRGVKR